MEKKFIFDRRLRVDSLLLYINNHTSSFFIYCVFALALSLLYFFLYGLPEEKGPLLLGYSLLGFSAFATLLQLKWYQVLSKKPNLFIFKNFKSIITTITLLKLCYILGSFSVVLFVHDTELKELNVLGYFISAFLLMMYSSTSIVCIHLYIIDISIQLSLCLLMAIAGYGVFYSDLLILGALFVLFFTVYTSYRAYQADRNLLYKNKRRTPLTGIMGMVEVLNDTTLTKNQRKHLESINSCSNTLISVLNDLLDLSKMEVGKFTINKMDMDLYSLIDTLVLSMGAKGAKKGLKITMSYQEGCPKEIHGDPIRLQQIIGNLLSNAIKFTDEGHIDVGVLYNSENQKIYIKVTDTGIGLSKEEQSRLFNKFSQANDNTAQKYGGTGLGLSISMSLAKMMGGDIKLTSKKGEGSQFVLILPYEELVGSIESLERNNKEQKPDTAIVYVKELEVLVVEDNNTNQVIIENLLKKHDHKVDVASSGEEALNFIKDSQYDLILMDMMMPGMDGIETTKKIKKFDEYYKEVPIIALTANTDHKTRLKCIDAGMCDRVTKPIDSLVLYTAIAEHTPEEKRVNIIHAEEYERMINEEAVLDVEEVMGKDYKNQYVRDAISEMNGLTQKLNQAYRDNNTSKIKDIAHQLKAVTGALGLNAFYNLSEDLESINEETSGDELIRMIKLLNKYNFEDTIKVYQNMDKHIEGFS
jgi:signal transduction histidine kinase/CheY-like chemotaxis protein